METVNKLKNSKEVIAHLAELFPQCFSVKGEAKPLKIGIFQDLAERLKDDESVSNTLLRSALRQYTSSWRYLHGVKVGVNRVDLDGQPTQLIEQEHADHAQLKLKESKEKVFGQQTKAAKNDASSSSHKKAAGSELKNKPAPRRPQKNVKSRTQPKVIPSEELCTGKQIRVLVGKIPMPGVITEIVKNDISVQLNSGMQVKVKKEHIVA
ncbi:RNA chaperone ProQ [Celerinatantimonas sp. YJH-8]|uniref:RNA chaperone ProQ n=1 Tax=Celerinatantimonas sp. YJH-8 TaxID=3228714 RepID=UPI0038C7824B